MDFIKTILELILKHGGVGTFMLASLSLIIFHLGIVIAFSKFDTDSWPEIIKRLIMKVGRKKALQNSTFFQSMIFLKVGAIPRMNIKCKLRKKLFGRMLTIKVEALEFVVAEFIKKESAWRDVETDDLEIDFKSILAEADLKFQRDCKDRAIPDVAMDAFKMYNQQKMDILDEIIISSALSKYGCPDNHDRVLLFLDALSGREAKSFDSVEKVIDTLNGEISRLTFENECCTQCDPDCPFKTPPLAPHK